MQISDPHPVHTLAAHHLGMLAIPDMPTKDTAARLPPDLVAGFPHRPYALRQHRRRPGIALAGLPGLAAG